MRMHIGHADTGRGPAEGFEKAIGGERRSALTHEEVTRSGRLIAARFAKRTELDAAQRLYAVVAALTADYLQSASFEVDLVPAQSHELSNAQPMPVSH